MPHSIAKPDSSDQRRSERIEVFLRTSLSTSRKPQISSQLVNISTMGFMARTAESFEQEDKLRILLPYAGDVSARVVWSLGGRIGCAFDHPFDEREFAKVLGAIKTAKPNWQSR